MEWTHWIGYSNVDGYLQIVEIVRTVRIMP